MTDRHKKRLQMADRAQQSGDLQEAGHLRAWVQSEQRSSRGAPPEQITAEHADLARSLKRTLIKVLLSKDKPQEVRHSMQGAIGASVLAAWQELHSGGAEPSRRAVREHADRLVGEAFYVVYRVVPVSEGTVLDEKMAATARQVGQAAADRAQRVAQTVVREPRPPAWPAKAAALLPDKVRVKVVMTAKVHGQYLDPGAELEIDRAEFLDMAHRRAWQIAMAGKPVARHVEGEPLPSVPPMPFKPVRGAAAQHWRILEALGLARHKAQITNQPVGVTLTTLARTVYVAGKDPDKSRTRAQCADLIKVGLVRMKEPTRAKDADALYDLAPLRR